MSSRHSSGVRRGVSDPGGARGPRLGLAGPVRPEPGSPLRTRAVGPGVVEWGSGARPITPNPHNRCKTGYRIGRIGTEGGDGTSDSSCEW